MRVGRRGRGGAGKGGRISDLYFSLLGAKRGQDRQVHEALGMGTECQVAPGRREDVLWLETRRKAEWEDKGEEELAVRKHREEPCPLRTSWQ